MPHLTADQIQADGAKWASYFAKTSWIVQREHKDGWITERIAKQCGPSARVMELGTGSGGMLERLRTKGFNALGVDIVNYVQDPALAQHVRLADLNRDPIPAETGSQDAVVMLEIFEHLENPFHILRECARVLRPGGLLFLSTPTGRSLADRWSFFRTGNLPNFHKKNNHISFLTPAVWHKATSQSFVTRDRVLEGGFLQFLRPKRLNKYLPAHPLLSRKACTMYERLP